MHSARMLRSTGKYNTDCPVLSCNLSIYNTVLLGSTALFRTEAQYFGNNFCVFDLRLVKPYTLDAAGTGSAKKKVDRSRDGTPATGDRYQDHTLDQ